MKRAWWWRCAGLVFIIALLTFNFAAVGKYASYPWWHQHDCDSDPLYVAQAVTIVNNGPFDYIHHPGAVVSCGHGSFYRLAASIGGWHPEYLDLRSTAPTVSAWDLLDNATRVSRWLSFAAFAVFVATFYGLVLWITRETATTFLVTFFVATSEVAIWHSRAIRPEIPSLLFSLLALWVVVAPGLRPTREEKWRSYLAAFALGLFLALAMFSKIQILPVVACLLILGSGRAWINKEHGTQADTNHRLRVSLGLGFSLALVVPWWALRRPDFVTEPYLESIGYFDRLVYGSMTASFAPLAAATIGLSLIGAVVGLVLVRRPDGKPSAERLARLLTFLQMVGLGAVAGAYAVVAPASRTFSSYVQNTHHLVYGVIANTFGNVFGSGFLHHKTVDGNTAARIIDAHTKGDPLLGVNIVWLIGLVAVVVLVRIFASKTLDRAKYWYILLLLGSGVAMDVVFTLRWVAQFNYYAIFSLVFYALAMAWFLKLERQNLRAEGYRLRLSYAVAVLMVGLFISHVGFRTYELVTAPRATGISDQSPKPMLDSTRQQNPHFWSLFEEAP
jgi:hypothetical protein